MHEPCTCANSDKVVLKYLPFLLDYWEIKSKTKAVQVDQLVCWATSKTVLVAIHLYQAQHFYLQVISHFQKGNTHQGYIKTPTATVFCVIWHTAACCDARHHEFMHITASGILLASYFPALTCVKVIMCSRWSVGVFFVAKFIYKQSSGVFFCCCQ